MKLQIHFLFQETLDGYVFNPHRPGGLKFLDEKDNVEIWIKSRGKEGDFDYGHGNLEIIAMKSCEATVEQIEFVDLLINDKTVMKERSGLPLPYVVRGEERVSAEGKVAAGYSPTEGFLPADLRSLCLSIGQELEAKAIRFAELLRWQEAATGRERISDRKDPRFSLYWKTDQEVYHGVPWPKQDEIKMRVFSRAFTWTELDQINFSELWQKTDVHEPLGHQLLREAVELSQHSDRSALLTCYSALEVGLKQHISKCAPQVGWLAMKAPTPPLFNIIRDYLPIIHAGKPYIDDWSKVRPELKLLINFTDDRNALAHRGGQITGDLQDYIRITEDLLYSFDVFEGHEWAKSRVSKRFGDLLGWESRRQSLLTTIRMLE